MRRGRTSPAGNRSVLSEPSIRHVLAAGGASSLRQSDSHRPAGTDADSDPDLAALKSAWKWNFAGAPRTQEQEEKQWFQPHCSLSASMRSRHRATPYACARCGQPLAVDELISHQSECLGEREHSSDEDASGTKPRWRGPLDKDKDPPKALRALHRSFEFDDPLEFDFDFMKKFGTFQGARRGGSFFDSARPPDGFPKNASSRFMYGTSRSAGGSSASSRMGADAGWERSKASTAPPPRKPPSPPPRSASSGAGAASATPSTASLDAALKEHESRWATFEGAQAANIRYGDVPWPDFSTSSDALLVQHALRKAVDAQDVKNTLRRLQLRWHPDKWAQRFVARLSSQDSERVLARVKEVAQLVNGLKASC